MADAAPPALEEILGRELRALRERFGLRQEQIAEEARRFGLRWQRGTIAMLESGRRHLSPGEWLALPSLVRAATRGAAGAVALQDLLPDDAQSVRLAGDLVLSGQELRRIFARPEDQPRPRWAAFSGTATFTLSTTATLTTAPLPRRWRDDALTAIRRWRRASGASAWRKVEPVFWQDARVEALGDAEQKAASALGVPPLAVVLAAHARWGHGLRDERERHLGQRGPLDGIPARRLQAMRGQITRRLMAELQPGLATVTARRRRAKQ
jgi:transcriptional regulator with XRE-family HTH domain